MSTDALNLEQYLLLEGQDSQGQTLEVIPVPELPPDTPGLTPRQWVDIKVYAVAKLMEVARADAWADSIGVTSATLYTELEVRLHQVAQKVHGGDSKRWAESIRLQDGGAYQGGDAAIAAVYAEGQRLLAKLTISRLPSHQGAELDLDEIQARPASWVIPSAKAHKSPTPWDHQPLDGVAISDLVTREEWLTMAAGRPTLICGVPNLNHDLGPSGWLLDRPPRAGTASGRQAHYAAQRDAVALNLTRDIQKALHYRRCPRCQHLYKSYVRPKAEALI